MNQLPVFVYGTLLPGQPNHHLIRADIVTAQSATLTGCRLYDMGHFPMLVEGGQDSVRGQLLGLRAEGYPAAIARLDRLERYEPAEPEGSLYRRAARSVDPEEGASELAWVYLGRAELVATAAPIPGGDWRAYSAGAYADLHRWWAKLGSALLDGPDFGNSSQLGQNK